MRQDAWSDGPDLKITLAMDNKASDGMGWVTRWVKVWLGEEIVEITWDFKRHNRDAHDWHLKGSDTLCLKTLLLMGARLPPSIYADYLEDLDQSLSDVCNFLREWERVRRESEQ